MPDSKTQRLRDPVHGSIVFREDEPIDQLAWQLIDTSEFQRLRRIKQLGVSELTFPGATHTRFAHSIGVFHNARTLVQIIEREMKRQGKAYDRSRADVAVIAALLHDLGHGPFSHTFEGVQKSRGVKKRHEIWTAEIISNPDGGIRPLLEGFLAERDFCADVSELLEAEDPEDIYHAVVSSSFDADRLDYLRRDRLMTGTGAGAIDFDWLMDNVRVADVAIPARTDRRIDRHEFWLRLGRAVIPARTVVNEYPSSYMLRLGRAVIPARTRRKTGTKLDVLRLGRAVIPARTACELLPMAVKLRLGRAVIPARTSSDPNLQNIPLRLGRAVIPARTSQRGRVSAMRLRLGRAVIPARTQGNRRHWHVLLRLGRAVIPARTDPSADPRKLMLRLGRAVIPARTGATVGRHPTVLRLGRAVIPARTS